MKILLAGLVGGFIGNRVLGTLFSGIAEVLSPLRDIDKWVRHKLRCDLWKHWGPSGYRELRKRGVSIREAWNTSKSEGPRGFFLTQSEEN